MRLRCPSAVEEVGVAEFADTLRHCVGLREDVELDLAPDGFAYPFGTLLLAVAVRQFVRERKAADRATRAVFPKLASPATTYLGHVGFYDFVGLPRGKEVGAARGSATYFPIRRVTRGELDLRADGRYHRELERRCHDLAALVIEDEYEQNLVAYCFREVVRNVFEHGDVDECYAMAQKWSHGQVEVAVVDEGRGVAASLRERYADLTTPEEAIEKALLPGVTRVTGPQDRGDWDNTGFGLYVLSQLGKQHGAFAIASGGVLASVADEGTRYARLPVGGTAIKVRVRTQDAEYFPNTLASIVAEGERLAETVAGTVVKASGKSRTAPRGGNRGLIQP